MNLVRISEFEIQRSSQTNSETSVKSFVHLDCTPAFTVSFSKSEMWTVPIIKPNNWNIDSPHHGPLDLDW